MAIFTCLAMLLAGKKKKIMDGKKGSGDGETVKPNDETQSMKRDYSDFDLQNKVEIISHGSNTDLNNHAFSASPVLKRSCSNIEIKRARKSMNSSDRSYSELKNLSRNDIGQFTFEADSSPLSAKTSSCHELSLKLDEQKKSMDSENRRISFSLQSSPQDRVFDWVNSLDDCTFCPVGVEEDEWTAGPHHMENGECSGKNYSYATPRAAEEVSQANNIIQCLSSFSSVAHFSGMGLKLIPSIAAFGSLRSVSLCGNFIAHITPGCLPKHIHSLDLSRNKISTIEGLRDLTRLRVLNLSNNRISRIGHGLSNCTAIKELNLAGNKISDVEGLHRLLKLTALDLSFNKITTTKAFGQLVANYNSLSSLNLIGNSIQSNMGEDQIRKAVLSLLPRISCFNKQPIKQHRLREAGANIAAKAAIGDGGWSSRRRPTRRLAHGSGSSTTKRKIGEGSYKGRTNQSMSKHQHSSFVRK